MNALATARRLSIGLVATLLALSAMAAAARANELDARQAAANGFRLHTAEETLAEFCHWEGDRLFFELPDGLRFELVTSTSDPEISNPGDGTFHPFDERAVKEALNEVRFPLDHVAADIYLLPYPRRGGLESAAGPGLVLLAPGVRPLPTEQQHAEFVHELGHVVQYALMPDHDQARWEAYRRIRGLHDTQVYAAGAAHADRPHEIFAEDFRALYGGARANYSGTIENDALAHPSQVRGLESFMRELATPAEFAAIATVAAFPNPSRGAVEFSRPGSAAPWLDVFDAQGRRIATVPPRVVGSRVAWSWNGRDARGARVAGGVVWARARDGHGGTTRVVVE